MIKHYIKQEQGRSMVEMLGVLAIIGVLSVGGISGYTTAMNKHKANEILNAAAVRAMAVSTQLQSGAETPTLGEFSSTEKIGGATFTGVDKVGDNQFRLNFGEQPSPAVLTQMQNIAGDNVGVDITRLLYNNDLSSGVDGKNTNKDEDGNCIDSYGLDCETSCPTGTSTNATTHTGGQVNTTGCYCSTGYVWDSTADSNKGACVEDTPACKGAESVGDDCEDNEGLCPGYYCHVDINADYSEGEVCSPANGRIKSVGIPEPVTWFSGAYRSPTSDMAYDSAWNYCEALKDVDDTVVDSTGNSVKGKVTQGLYQTTSDYIEKEYENYYYWVNKNTGSPSNIGTSCDVFVVSNFGSITLTSRLNGGMGGCAVCK